MTRRWRGALTVGLGAFLGLLGLLGTGCSSTGQVEHEEPKSQRAEQGTTEDENTGDEPSDAGSESGSETTDSALEPADMNGRWCYEPGIEIACFTADYPKLYGDDGTTSVLTPDPESADACLSFFVGYEGGGGGAYLVYCPIGVETITAGDEQLDIERMYVGQDAPGALATRE